MLRPNDTILFQGDSITNALRHPDELNNAFQMGNGYAFLIAARLLFERPADDLTFYNRGVSGNTTRHLLERWQTDCLDLRPDVVSLLIGVNDANVPLAPDEYEGNYRQLLEQTEAKLPDVRWVLCEPFLLDGRVASVARQEAIAPIQRIVRSLARERNAVFVPLQALFDDAVQKAPPSYWAYDGVHATAAGFELMARAWLEAVGREA